MTLVLVAHPKCPCTRATLEQLALIISRSSRPTQGYVLFSKPSDVPSSWAHTALWDKAAEIPGMHPVEDLDGHEARLFGTTTSGHLLAFDAEGRLGFSGGITSARGAQGESAGMTSCLHYLSTGSARFVRTPVFGCPLGNEEWGK